MKAWRHACVAVAVAFMVLAGVAFAGVFSIWIGIVSAVLGFGFLAAGTYLIWLEQLDL